MSSSVFSNVRSFLEQQPNVAAALEKSSSPNILFTSLPKHWRSNKSFQDQFMVVLLTPVPDNTEVSIWAGNDEAPCGEVRNERAKVHRQIAKFNDLRFVGRSGRGRKFHMTIVIHSTPMMVATVKNIIKVTVDGPRDARIPKPATGQKRSASPYRPEFPPQLMTPQILPPPNIWPWHMQMIPPQFFPMIPPTTTTSSSTIFPTFSTSFLGPPPQTTRKRDDERTPNKTDSENECLNTSAFGSPPSAPSSSEKKSIKTEEESPKPFPSSISLTQSTPDSVPTKRKRTSSITSSNGSSPTIWRPFE